MNQQSLVPEIDIDKVVRDHKRHNTASNLERISNYLDAARSDVTKITLHVTRKHAMKCGAKSLPKDRGGPLYYRGREVVCIGDEVLARYRAALKPTAGGNGDAVKD